MAPGDDASAGSTGETYCGADGIGHSAQRKWRSNIVSNIGNFSIQYNFTSASIAVQVLGSDQPLGRPLYPAPAWGDGLALAAVFVGSMAGMLVMGRLGDVLGRSRAMQVTTALAALGALIPACAAGPPGAVYGVLCLGRFVLGVGVGGIYPLSAVHSAESSGSRSGRGSRVSWAFFWQSPGGIAPYALAMVLFAAIRPEPAAAWAPQLEFRLLFALGMLPAAVVFFASCAEEESDEFTSAALARSGQRLTVWGTLRREPAEIRRALVGTAGSWFCFDVAYYGASVFTPVILDDICLAGHKVGGVCSQSLFQTALQSAIVQAVGIPGVLLAIVLIGRMGSKRLNVYGFILLALNLVFLAVVSACDRSAHALLFVLFCSLTFLLNFGPSLGTYVLPAVCFPAHIRATCHGLSAFGGKLGAVVGTLIFPVIAGSRVGLSGVFCTQAVLCILGACISQRFLQHDTHYEEPLSTSILAGGQERVAHDAGAGGAVVGGAGGACA
mmetsp:Transcript_52718/g.160242  ORF Transcript_52718/g.160242 Transcript_52718/m.160242 type:complete len:498 (-) Transcript_52718:8-1501(-)